MGALTLIAPVLPLLIRGVEALFGKGTGETKASLVTDFVKKIAELLAAGGTVSSIPDTTEIRAAIDAVVARLNEAKVLQGPATKLSTDSQQITQLVAQMMRSGAGILEAMK